MGTIRLDAQVISGINYLVKHLYDNPADHPTNTPKYTPMGEEITEIKEISAVLGVDQKVASIYVLQDPNAAEELKSQAREVISPGIFIASDDMYLPVVHKAFEILHNPGYVDTKQIRMVRSLAGAQRFGQRVGSVIVDDGEAPLDALVALDNDIPGYEKVASKSGDVFYVGKEGNKFVVRNPRTGKIIKTAQKEGDAYRWLNKALGGAESNDERAPEKDSNRFTLDDLTDAELAIYNALRARGLDHNQAFLIIKRNFQTPSRKKPKPGKRV